MAMMRLQLRVLFIGLVWAFLARTAPNPFALRPMIARLSRPVSSLSVRMPRRRLKVQARTRPQGLPVV